MTIPPAAGFVDRRSAPAEVFEARIAPFEDAPYPAEIAEFRAALDGEATDERALLAEALSDWLGVEAPDVAAGYLMPVVDRIATTRAAEALEVAADAAAALPMVPTKNRGWWAARWLRYRADCLRAGSGTP